MFKEFKRWYDGTSKQQEKSRNYLTKTDSPIKQKAHRILSKEPQRSIVYLVSLIFVRAGIQISLYQQGFISVAADEFARGIRAAKWAENPQINILSDVQGTWLPSEKYLNGLLLMAAIPIMEKIMTTT